MFKLTEAEVNALRAKDYTRRMSALRAEFVDLEENDPRSGQYFDENHYVTERLEALSGADIILLLRIGFIQNLPLITAPQFKECQTRGQWYGRRLWLKDQFEKLHNTGE